MANSQEVEGSRPADTPHVEIVNVDHIRDGLQSLEKLRRVDAVRHTRHQHIHCLRHSACRRPDDKYREEVGAERVGAVPVGEAVVVQPPGV